MILPSLDFYSPSKQATFHTPEPNHPDNDPDSNGYLHLTDFETPNIEEKSPNVPGFLEVTKVLILSNYLYIYIYVCSI